MKIDQIVQETYNYDPRNNAGIEEQMRLKIPIQILLSEWVDHLPMSFRRMQSFAHLLLLMIAASPNLADRRLAGLDTGFYHVSRTFEEEMF